MVYRTRRTRRLRKPTRRFPRRRTTGITRRRRVRRPNFRNKATIVSNRFGSGMPDAFNVKLKYHTGLALQSTALQEITAFYRGNVPWDPDTRIGDTSALEYDRFAAIYRYCRCYASKIRIKALTFNNSSAIIAVCPVTSEQPLSFNLMMADKRAKSTQFMTPAGMTRTGLSSYCTTKAIFGLKNRINDNDHEYDFNNATTNIPSYNWFWYIIASTPEGLSGALNVPMEIQITYYCRFFEKIQPQYATPDDSDFVIPWSGQNDDDDNIFIPDPPPS